MESKSVQQIFVDDKDPDNGATERRSPDLPYPLTPAASLQRVEYAHPEFRSWAGGVNIYYTRGAGARSDPPIDQMLGNGLDAVEEPSRCAMVVILK